MTTNASKKAWSTLSMAAIILLTGLSGYLWNERTKLNQSLENVKSELTQVNHFYDELETEFDAATAELNNLKTDNVELNNLIENQKAELLSQKNRIARLFRENKDLGQAKIELNELRKRVSGYIVQIDELKAQNEALAHSNFALREEKKILTGEIQSEREKSEQILAAKTLLVSENENLLTEKERLSKKISIASVIQVADVQVQGYKVRSSGKLSKKSKAKKVNIIQVCFKADDNLVVTPGQETFIVRIVNPMGETLFMENKGSGVMINEADDQLRYTSTVDVAYENTEVPVCMQWQPDIPFMKGVYQIEIYNKGYRVAQTDFKLN